MNANKLSNLVEHAQQGGDLDAETLAEVLKITAKSRSTMEKYLAGLAERDETFDGISIGDANPYDEIEEGEEEEEEEEGSEGEEGEEEQEEEKPDSVPPAERPKPQKKSRKDYQFFFEDTNGTSIELIQAAKSPDGKIITFKQKPIEPITDNVAVMINGQVETVDIVALRKLNGSELHESFGITNEILLRIALAAKPSKK